ncbi:hypothetical protein CONPUDRAFT_162758 [Coniophora puteana RWD-64-598 SS2]|uniref:HMG box domain-containing protein n=1 Tax=Coniophora puteana (strain RWD-64-598) TaxID=741705 RepID=A0A5M3N2H4_CONPW|nr:uncharacterized protein CONPUDRAFT_162758 [Coniophora puteana RWD-64-598 SS2]EIW85590.1 hypothetical protein CONPUDRAFT_162758 [Coniophora puteana RWD-64-598 SS2]
MTGPTNFVLVPFSLPPSPRFLPRDTSLAFAAPSPPPSSPTLGMAQNQVHGWCPALLHHQGDAPVPSYPMSYCEPPAYVPSQFPLARPTPSIPSSAAAQPSLNYDTPPISTRPPTPNLPSSSQPSSKPSLTGKAPSTIRRFSRKAADDPNYIPRPRNAFIIFRCDYTEKHKLDNAAAAACNKDGSSKPNLPAKTLSKRAAEAWRALPEAAKEEWKIRAKQEALVHQETFPEYKFRPAKPNSRSTGDAHPSQVYEQCWAASTLSRPRLQLQSTPASTCASEAPSRHISPTPTELEVLSAVDDGEDAELLARRRASLPPPTAYPQFLLPSNSLSRNMRRSRSLATHVSGPFRTPVRPPPVPHPYGAYSTGSLPVDYTPSPLNYMYLPTPDPTYTFPPNDAYSSPTQNPGAAYQPATVSPLSIHSAYPPVEPPEPHVSPLAHVATTWNGLASEPSTSSQDLDLSYPLAESPSDTSPASNHLPTPASPPIPPPAYTTQAVEPVAAPAMETAAKKQLASPARSEPAPIYRFYEGEGENGAGLPGYDDTSHAHAAYTPADHANASGYGLDHLAPSLYRSRSEGSVGVGAGYSNGGVVDLTNYHTGLMESGILPGGGISAFRVGDPFVSGDNYGYGYEYGVDDGGGSYAYAGGDHEDAGGMWGSTLLDEDFSLQSGQVDIHELIERRDTPVELTRH